MSPPGQPGTPPPAGQMVGACGGGAVATPLRRLTNFEYDNTLRDLFPQLPVGRPSVDLAFTGEAVEHLFDNATGTQALERDRASNYLEAAERVAALAVARLAETTGCQRAEDDTCVLTFIEGFAGKAFRRPLEAGDPQSLRAFHAQMKELGGPVFAVQAAIERILQSPRFIYRIEPPGAGGRHDGWTIASRLSYFLTGTMPDSALREAARAGLLDTEAGVEAQARRLLRDNGAWQSWQHFAQQWLGLDKVTGDALHKDEALFPGWSSSVMNAMRLETESLFKHAVGREDVPFGDLFAARYTFVEAPLARFYGMQTPRSGTSPTMLDPGRAAGVLTHGSFLAATADDRAPVAIFRGKHVRERFLCAPVPVPDVLIPDLEEPKPTVTSRQRVEEHSKNPCATACHALLDPIGFAFEHYDAVGRWRDSDNGLPIDDSGAINGGDVGDAQGKFKGAAELGAKLAGSQRARQCLTENLFRYALGRGPGEAHGRSSTTGDECSLARVTRALEGKGSLSDAIVALTLSDAFVRGTTTGGK